MFRHFDTRLLHDEPAVLAVGCDLATAETLKAAIRPTDLRLESYASIEQFLAACDPTRPGCILLHQQLADGREDEVFGQLAQRRVHLPVIVLAARGEVAAAVRVVRAGAFGFLPKPWSAQRLVEALEAAIHWEADRHVEILNLVRIERRLARLSDGERQVLELIVQGMPERADRLVPRAERSRRGDPPLAPDGRRCVPRAWSICCARRSPRVMGWGQRLYRFQVHDTRGRIYKSFLWKYLWKTSMSR